MANSVDPDQTAPMSSLFWAHTVCFYSQFVSNVRQLFAADDFSRRYFQMHFFLGALRVKMLSHLFITGDRTGPSWFSSELST